MLSIFVKHSSDWISLPEFDGIMFCNVPGAATAPAVAVEIRFEELGFDASVVSVPNLFGRPSILNSDSQQYSCGQL